MVHRLRSQCNADDSVRWTGVPHGVLLTAALGVLWGVCPGVETQIPAICAGNVTRSGVCCPSWTKGGDTICGGPDRGRCVRLHSEDDVSKVPRAYRHDDRLYWPIRLIQFACECHGNYAGYMCHECRDGFKGDNCAEKFVRIRRNVNNLTVSEKQYVIDVMDASRYVASDYVILNMTHSSDPLRQPDFLEVSVFDYLAYLHYYASRMTNLANDTACESATYRMDCAHRGSNFPVWHRYYMTQWEKAMGKVAGDPTFAFPYWDWTDGGRTCQPCTDDFLGVTNASDPDGTIRTTNRISGWYVLCYAMNDCETCDPGMRFALVRNPGKNPEAAILPSADDVNSFMALDAYDYPDYVTRSRATSFRARLEGYSTRHGSTTKLRMHNLVHGFMNGSFSGALTSSFDPVFYLHHSFMDLLLETWIRRTGAHPSQLPSVGSHPGHHRDSYLVAFFPVAKASWYFTTSRHLGYDYDAMYDMTPAGTDSQATDDVTSDESVNVTTTESSSENEQSLSSLNGSVPHTTSGTDAVPMTMQPPASEEPVNPLLRYLIIEGAIIGVLLIALISECTLRFRYFVKHHGYTQLDLASNEKLWASDKQKLFAGEDDDKSDCE